MCGRHQTSQELIQRSRHSKLSIDELNNISQVKREGDDLMTWKYYEMKDCCGELLKVLFPTTNKKESFQHPMIHYAIKFVSQTSLIDCSLRKVRRYGKGFNLHFTYFLHLVSQMHFLNFYPPEEHWPPNERNDDQNLQKHDVSFLIRSERMNEGLVKAKSLYPSISKVFLIYYFL